MKFFVRFSFDRFPFDTSTGDGFIGALVISEIAGLTATVFFAVMISFYVGICWLFVACLNETTAILQQIDMIIVRKSSDEHQQVTKHLLEFIEYHAWTGRLVNHEIFCGST